ncbi:HisA/HisF-related TIM barrel protein [Trinickia caryophylli]|uniref:Phosphoribosylformimino-5-aminoimidazole carboxamide ribotide isomerase n=1 Tax=Trinickia caryophylli TaxID=28094 RepID=A0A1X7E2L7_TRICW|nr:HisA/HisF-related TIM barrel protein [Trinickia caryophylli]PMS14035.1 phosphoribosylformimino-5-aminoimidazole carboxamide ribotide isomerase [Trinickia caryophylli]TRX17729.1 phosphoribosylformimino-5-aminoimidazole carboxamide ribotide isomerase [Trinickia caryophylli]WQE11510.1 HisA/HisF-related TIM barrel protein [Trinickia caryophylli]SMF26067.1 phosphoribosylformimino-5-aminoimidazole carboxamide ribotide isomerase [Trinickia caryophylli]GLU32674.1 nickel transporter [Trinickia caryo
MLVIPVLDLLGGEAVRAVRGERANYRPLRSALAATSEPIPLARALVHACSASALYIADLDAILGHGDHAAVLAALRAELPEAEIWLDGGFADYRSMRSMFERIEAAGPAPDAGQARLVPVFGTESLRDVRAIAEAEAGGFEPILSLDHRGGRLVADSSFALGPAAWPARVIVMTLDQVGSYGGPDLATFARIGAQAAPETTIVGAGGIRAADDLARAAAAGARAWLVASALHDERLGLVAAQQPRA